MSLQLLSELPVELSERVLILTLEARSPTAVAYAAIVLEITRSIDIELTAPVFEEPYYLGSYAEIDGLSFDQQLRLIDGFDASVVFSLEGGNFVSILVAISLSDFPRDLIIMIESQFLKLYSEMISIIFRIALISFYYTRIITGRNSWIN